MGSASGIRAGKAFVEVSADKTRLVKDLKTIGADMKTFGAGIAAIGTRVMGLGAAITGPLALATKSFMASGAALDDMAQRTGLSTNALSELGWAAQMSGTDMQGLEKAIRYMQKTLGSSGEGTETEFMRAMSELERIPDMTARAQRAMEIFGARSGTAILPMVGNIQKFREEAVKLGLSIGPEQAQRAAEMDDAWDRVKRSIGAVMFNIGDALASSGLLDNITNVVGSISRWVKQNDEVIRTVAKVGAGLVAGGAAMFAFGKAISAAGSLILGMFTASKFAASGLSILTTGFSILTNPLGIAVAGIAAISAGLLYLARDTKAVEYVRSTILGYTDDITSMFRSLVSEAMTTWQGITDAVSAGRLDLAWAVLTETMKLAWVSMVNSFYDIIEPFRVWWSDTTFGLASLFVDGLASIESAWVSMLSVMRKLWAEFIASGFIENMLVRFNNVFGPILERLGISLNEGAIRSLSKDQRDKLPGTYANIDAETAARQADIESRRRASQGALGDDMAEAARRRQADIDKRGDDLERAKAARDAAIAESRTAAENAAKDREARKPFIPGEFGDLASGKGKVAGTFSASEAANMGGRSTLDKMLAEFRKGTNLQGRLVFENKETNRRLGALNMELQP